MLTSWLRADVVLNVVCGKEAGSNSGFFVVQEPLCPAFSTALEIGPVVPNPKPQNHGQFDGSHSGPLAITKALRRCN